MENIDTVPSAILVFKLVLLAEQRGMLAHNAKSEQERAEIGTEIGQINEELNRRFARLADLEFEKKMRAELEKVKEKLREAGGRI